MLKSPPRALPASVPVQGPLWKLVRRCLEKASADRFANARELLEALTALGPLQARRAGALQRLWRTRGVRIGAGVALAAAIGVTAIVVATRDEPRSAASAVDRGLPATAAAARGAPPATAPPTTAAPAPPPPAPAGAAPAGHQDALAPVPPRAAKTAHPPLPPAAQPPPPPPPAPPPPAPSRPGPP